MRGNLKEQKRTYRDGIDRLPTAAVFMTTASPFEKDDVAGVSMETSEPRTEEEKIKKSSRIDIFSSVSTFYVQYNMIRNYGIGNQVKVKM
jgi:hypothetical protein